ncbi:hypothetical protein GCM10012280_71530 [Wenjunlia tyrosinilytica]|uniref:Uncharacterized protein n=2 Tax=Wenjunlia tyrosinilytica TaxID=1544741 RepID=A0A917ZZE1_9ACTN|nr:hypothetical protein GCM10012280_71530 [Wenjunlia tyrosinilytica]
MLLSPMSKKLPTCEVLIVFLAAFGIRRHTGLAEWRDAWTRLAMAAQTDQFTATDRPEAAVAA